MKRFWQSQSLQLKVALVFGSISLLPLVISGGASLYNASKGLEQQVQSKLVSLAEAKEQALNSFYHVAARNAEALAQSSAMHQFLNLDAEGEENDQIYQAAYEATLNYQEAHWGMYHHVFVTDRLGQVVLSPGHNGSDKSHLEQNIAAAPFFQSALKEQQVTDFFGFEETDHYHQLLLQPILTPDGESLGLLVFEISIEHVLALLNGKEDNEDNGNRC